jgi:ribosomal protein L7/L12
LVLLAGVLALALLGCEEDQGGTTRDTDAPTTGETARETPGVQPVPEGQGGAGTTTPGGTPGAPGGIAGEAATQQRNAYVQGAEQILNGIEQKFTAWQQQAGTQAQQNQQVQQLSQQVQTELADAKAAVDKMRTATGSQLKDAKVAADQAIRDVEEAFKNLQSQTGQTQVTQVE